MDKEILKKYLITKTINQEELKKLIYELLELEAKKLLIKL